jgi:hypothetical protein
MIFITGGAATHIKKMLRGFLNGWWRRYAFTNHCSEDRRSAEGVAWTGGNFRFTYNLVSQECHMAPKQGRLREVHSHACTLDNAGVAPLLRHLRQSPDVQQREAKEGARLHAGEHCTFLNSDKYWVVEK